MNKKTILNLPDITKEIESVVSYNSYVKRVGIFGSYARNEATNNSDIDFVLDYTNLDDVIGYFSLCDEIEKLFAKYNISVDMIQYEAITYPENRIIKEEIDRDVVWVYG